MTTPPTAEETDAWAADNAVPNMVVQGLAVQNQLITACVFGYTQNDGTPAFQSTQALPTEDPATATLAAGLTAQYGEITIRAYRYTFDVPAPAPADVIVPDTDLETISDSSNWDTP